MKQANKRPGRGVLVILALFLASSGALRIGAGIGTAMAKTSPDSPPSEIAQTCPQPPAALAAALMERETDVTNQETALADRMAALALAEEAIKTRLNELATAEADLRKSLQMADGASEADLTRLTAVYEAMKSADATKLFSAMAPEFASGFLGRMTPATAAAVMAGMTPEKAYSISVLIAGRNALVPKN